MKIIKTILLPLSLFVFSITLYCKTLLPDVDFWDTGEFQTIAYTFNIAHPTGYPTYIVLGKIFLTIFPFGNVAWRMNLLSAIYTSFGIAIIGILIRKITKSFFLSLSLGVLLAVCPILWNVSVVADPHSLHFLFSSIFLSLTYKILVEKKIHLLPILYFITGLSLGNHMLSIFFLPSLLMTTIFVIKKGMLFLVGKSFALFFLGVSIYYVLFFISSAKLPLTINYNIHTFNDLRRLVLGQDFSGLMGTWARDGFEKTLLFYLNLVSTSLPYLFFIFPPVGLFLQFKQNIKFAISTLLLFAGTLLFSLRYQNAAIERYFIIPQIIYVIWIAYFFSFMRKGADNKFGNQKLNKIFTIIYSAIILFCSIILLVQNYKDIDQSHNYRAKEWSTQVLQNLEPNSVIFSWWSYSTPLWYQQKVIKQREDILIINKSVSEWESTALYYINRRPVYFIQPIEFNSRQLFLEPFEKIYRLKVSENHF